MPLIKNFRATTIWKAFILNSWAASLVIFIALTVKAHFDTYKDENGETIDHITDWKSVFMTLFVTFIASFSAYTLMYFIFGFGAGMLA